MKLGRCHCIYKYLHQPGLRARSGFKTCWRQVSCGHMDHPAQKPQNRDLKCLHKSLRNKTMDTETRCIVPLCFVRKLQYPELDIGPGPSAIRLTPGYKKNPKAVLPAMWYTMVTLHNQGLRDQWTRENSYMQRQTPSLYKGWCEKMLQTLVKAGLRQRQGKTYPIVFTSEVLCFSDRSSDSYERGHLLPNLFYHIVQRPQSMPSGTLGMD